MVVKTDGNGNILEFPYSYLLFILDFAKDIGAENLPLQKEMTEEIWNKYNVFVIHEGETPVVTETEMYFEQDYPRFDGEKWVTVFTSDIENAPRISPEREQMWKDFYKTWSFWERGVYTAQNVIDEAEALKAGVNNG